jgi:hypothetical protein
MIIFRRYARCRCRLPLFHLRHYFHVFAATSSYSMPPRACAGAALLLRAVSLHARRARVASDGASTMRACGALRMRAKICAVAAAAARSAAAEEREAARQRAVRVRSNAQKQQCCHATQQRRADAMMRVAHAADALPNAMPPFEVIYAFFNIHAFLFASRQPRFSFDFAIAAFHYAGFHDFDTATYALFSQAAAC